MVFFGSHSIGLITVLVTVSLVCMPQWTNASSNATTSNGTAADDASNNSTSMSNQSNDSNNGTLSNQSTDENNGTMDGTNTTSTTTSSPAEQQWDRFVQWVEFVLDRLGEKMETFGRRLPWDAVFRRLMNGRNRWENVRPFQDDNFPGRGRGRGKGRGGRGRGRGEWENRGPKRGRWFRE